MSRSTARWTALWAITGMLSLAGWATAGTRPSNGTRVVPVGTETKARSAAMATHTADGSGASKPAEAAKPAQAPAPAGGGPANDDCSGAIAIPNGPFPLQMPVVDISLATPQDVNEGWHPCAPGDLGGADRTIWYSFTPSVTSAYVFSTCTSGGATGTTVYDTVISVLQSIGGACPVPGAVLGCNDTALLCIAGVPGAPYVDQSIVTNTLAAGETYYISVGHWTDDAGGVSEGFSDIALLVDLSPAPGNDNCADPTPLTLNRVTQGTTVSATNDYRSAGDAACFSGIGQTPNTSPGIDVVYSFTAPADGAYNFRYVQDDATAALRGQNPSLYLSDVCPLPNPIGAVPCIKGANRISANGAANGNRSEEIDCVPMTAGEEVFLFFDDRGALNIGGDLAVEVTSCTTEVEPNGDLATATPYPGCFTMGSAAAVDDVDFFDLGAPPAGSKVFVGVDAVAANDGDFELRITNATDTLGYDDNDGTSWTSSNAPVIAGVIADGTNLYARVNKGSLAAQLAASEPYHLYARIEAGAPQDEVDSPSNASYYFGNHVTGGGFVRGVMTTQTDQDCFRFVANEGDEIVAFSDNNPDRAPGAITNVWPVLRDVVLAPPTASRFVGQVVRNLLTPSPGTLTGVTPSVTSEFFSYRARYSGTYMACFTPTQDIASTENPAANAYPLPYQGSISLNCGPIPAPASRLTDVSVTQTTPAGPVSTGGVVEYTITLTNDTGDIAEDVRLFNALPPELVFLNLGVDDGFGANNVGCISLPTPGTTDAPIDCTTFSIAPGATVVYTLLVQVANCIGAGIDVSNVVTVETLSTDPNPANDVATSTFTTSEDGSCADLLCDGVACITNECTVNDHCDAGVCVSDPLDCDDASTCTDDTCDPADSDGNPCVNDSSQLGDLCFDGNDCTTDACDPVEFCVFGPTSAGTACDDFLACTNSDACNGAGTCLGVSVCDDGQPCTDDFADEFNSCACDNPISFAGTGCDDMNDCTVGSVCDGVGGGFLNCTGTALPEGTACDDGSACRIDSTCNANGQCTQGTLIDCSDGNSCTANVCDVATGCGTADANFDATGFSASRVDGRDLVVFADAWNSCPADPRYDAAANLDPVTGTGSPAACIELNDFHEFMNAFGATCP